MRHIVLAACASLACASSLVAQQMTVRAENPLPVARTDETISLSWSAVRQQLPAATPERVRVVDSATNTELVSQVVDNEADGQPDELLFQASFWPREAKQLRVELAAPTTQSAARAYAKHDAYRDDVAWETDRIAFRIYGQGLWQASEFQPLVSSGIDVWPKRVRTLIIDKWYEKGHDAYHIDTGEGADFYTVGPTLGAGGSAIWRNGQLHRAKNFKAHRIIASGPIRLIFELDYEPWDAGGVQVSETKRITMDAGSNLFRQELTYRASGVDELQYVVGTVKREHLVGSTSRALTWAWLATWGPVETRNGGHGELGTAVLIENGRVADMQELPDHYVVIATARPGSAVTQYVGAGWTASGDFANVSAWWNYLNSYARRLEAPIRVTVVQ